MMYHVVTIGKYGEFEVLATDDPNEARERANDERYYIERDKRADSVEIRVYTDEDEQLDYDTIEF
jgi:hypothetical protein